MEELVARGNCQLAGASADFACSVRHVVLDRHGVLDRELVVRQFTVRSCPHYVFSSIFSSVFLSHDRQDLFGAHGYMSRFCDDLAI